MEERKPPVPGMLSLAWLFFMQPLRLHGMLKAWDIDPKIKLWAFLKRIWQGDSIARTLGARLLGILSLIHI